MFGLLRPLLFADPRRQLRAIVAAASGLVFGGRPHRTRTSEPPRVPGCGGRSATTGSPCSAEATEAGRVRMAGTETAIARELAAHARRSIPEGYAMPVLSGGIPSRQERLLPSSGACPGRRYPVNPAGLASYPRAGDPRRCPAAAGGACGPWLAADAGERWPSRLRQAAAPGHRVGWPLQGWRAARPALTLGSARSRLEPVSGRHPESAERRVLRSLAGAPLQRRAIRRAAFRDIVCQLWLQPTCALVRSACLPAAGAAFLWRLDGGGGVFMARMGPCWGDTAVGSVMVCKMNGLERPATGVQVMLWMAREYR